MARVAGNIAQRFLLTQLMILFGAFNLPANNLQFSHMRPYEDVSGKPLSYQWKIREMSPCSTYEVNSHQMLHSVIVFIYSANPKGSRGRPRMMRFQDYQGLLEFPESFG